MENDSTIPSTEEHSRSKDLSPPLPADLATGNKLLDWAKLKALLVVAILTAFNENLTLSVTPGKCVSDTDPSPSGGKKLRKEHDSTSG